MVSHKGVTMKRFFMAALLLSMFGATGTEANSKSGTVDNPKQIPDSIVITSNRFPTPIEKDASSVTIITEEEIEKNSTVMVSELLKQVAGIDVVRSGGLGTQTSVFMRGTNSNHTLVLIDGVEMNNPSSPTTSFDFGSLNVSNIQRIEILRGPQSVLYGSDAVGGVIQIFTKRGFGNLRADIISEAGAYKTYTESINLSGSHAKSDYSLFVSRKDSDGFSTIRKDAGGIEKDGFESTDIIANVGIQLVKNYELTFNGRMSNADADIDQSYGVLDDPNYTSENKMKSFMLRFKNHNSNYKYFQPDLSVSLFNQDIKTINKEDDAHVGESSEFNSNGKRLKVSASNFMNVYNNINSIIGVEYENETFNSDYNSASLWGGYADTVNKVSASTFSLYGLDDWNVNDRFSVSGGVRYDDHEDFGSQFTYRFTSLYRFKSVGLTVKGTYGTAFKAPSLYQLNHVLYGNPDLQPEENKGWELGFEKNSPDNILQFGAAYFSNDIDNLIGFDEMFRSNNIAKATSKGIEAFAQILFKKSSVRIDFTYTDVKDKTNNSKILRRPKEKISFQLNHQFSDMVKANILIRTIGDRFDRDFRPYPFEDVVLAGYTVVDLSASYQVMQDIKVTGRVDNLFDEDYQDVLRYNTPNRSGYIGVKLSL